MQRRFWNPLTLKAAHSWTWLTGGLTALLLNSLGSSVSAQTILFQETFRGAATTDVFLSGGIGGFPCLTAATPATAIPPSIPSCVEGATDTVGSGALRITSNGTEQRGFVIYDRFIQSQFGLSITFDFFSFNGIGEQRADGITFFLIDSQATPTQAGSFGGSLGYAQRSFGGVVPDEPGIAGGYLGIGFDEFGNFANDAEGRGAGFFPPGAPPPGCEVSPFGRDPDAATRTGVPDSVTLRGPGNGTTGYCFLANSGTRPEGIDVPTTVRTAARRTARITLRPGTNPTVQVEIDFGAGFVIVIPERPAPPGLPDRFRFGFAASTGTFTNFHEIQNLVVRSLVPVPQPQLGVAKQVGVPVNNNDGTFTVPYLITVQNPSQVNLTSLQVTEDLSQTFAGVPAFSIVPGSLQSSALRVNPTFNGTSDTNLLAGTDILTFGQTATINFSVRLTPGTVTRTFLNTAIGTARDPDNNPVTDTSTNGTTPDANNNGNPGDDNTPTPVNLLSQFRLVKRITALTRGGAQTRFTQFVDDPGDINDTAPGFSQLSPVGLATVDRANPLRSGDEVEYTVYYLSDGTQPAFLANICDPIPVGTTFVANSLSIRRANSEAPGGSFFSPLAPLPPNNSCPDQTNARGAALFDLGTIPNTAGNNFGFVRFRARVN
ncbi:lectin-like domain-containing protein [Phormidesmis sp. 146-12]